MPASDAQANTSAGQATHLVWDWPVRIFHWSLVVLITTSIATGKYGTLTAMELHFYSGYAILTLLLFRVGWGFWGTGYARFSDFLKGPRAVAGYLKHFATQDTHAGHNPAGGWMILAMLILISLQAGSGLFITDDVFVEGPLANLASEQQQGWLGTIHHTNFKLILVLIALHLAALLAHLKIRGENLVPAMLHGRKAGMTAGITSHQWPAAIMLAAISTLSVFMIIRL